MCITCINILTLDNQYTMFHIIQYNNPSLPSSSWTEYNVYNMHNYTHIRQPVYRIGGNFCEGFNLANWRIPNTIAKFTIRQNYCTGRQSRTSDVQVITCAGAKIYFRHVSEYSYNRRNGLLGRCIPCTSTSNSHPLCRLLPLLTLSLVRKILNRRMTAWGPLLQRSPQLPAE